MIRAPVAVDVVITCVLEVLRACSLPLQMLAFLPFRMRWRRAAASALAEAGRGSYREVLDRLLRDHPPRSNGKRPLLFISAGEKSGEIHASHLVEAVRAAGGDAQWLGFGGARLQRTGCEVDYPLAEDAVMGLLAVFAAMPRLIRVYARFVRLLRDRPPDLCVLVDYPGLHLVMARTARRYGIPVVHYIAPQYWAWGQWRMRRYRRAVDASLTILPFEPTFFDHAGVPSAYVGHPLLDEVVAPTPSAELRRDALCIMPGSRGKEIRHLLPGMVRVAAALREEFPDLRVLLPHADPRRAELIREILDEHGGEFIEYRQQPVSASLIESKAAFVKSGTGALEATLYGVPPVVIYRLQGWFSRAFVWLFLTVPWFASVNLIAGRRIVPEITMGSERDWESATAELGALLRDGPRRDQCLEDLQAMRERLGQPGASARAAHFVLPYCGRASA